MKLSANPVLYVYLSSSAVNKKEKNTHLNKIK